MNRWLNVEAIQELLGWSPESIDLLINGLSPSILRSSDGKRIVIKLSDFKEYLIAVKKLADSFLGAPPSKKVKEKIPEPKEVKDNIKRLTGKEAAERLNCSYENLLVLIKKHGLPEKRYGRGRHIYLDDLEEFSSANQELIRSLESKTEGNVVTDAVPRSGELEKTQDNTEVPKEGDETGKTDQDQSQASTVPSATVPSADGLEVAVPQNTELKKDPIPDTSSVENDAKPEEESTPNKNGKQSDPADKETSQNNESVTNQEVPKEEGACKFVSIKLTKDGCKIDDVAMALHMSVTTPMKWIHAKAVQAKNVPGERGDELYIDPESLKAFLLKERNTVITFFDTKGAKKPH